jgi:dTMP kinase
MQPARARIKVLITDRFLNSNLAYQGNEQGTHFQLIRELHSVTVGLLPRIIYLLDIDPETALALKGSDVGWMELQGEEYLGKVGKEYLRPTANEPRIRIFDGTLPIRLIHRRIVRACLPVLVGEQRRRYGSIRRAIPRFQNQGAPRHCI